LSEDGSECISRQQKCNEANSEKPKVEVCPHRHAPYDINKDGSAHTDRVATPPPAPVKEEKKAEEKKEEKKEEAKAAALTQKARSDDFWNPPCDWHLSEDGSECISRQQKCNEANSEKPKVEVCPHRHAPYDINKDGSAHTDRVATPPPAPVKEEKKAEEKKEEKKEEAKALIQMNKKDNFWTPSCEWHLSEDGSDCVTRF